ncbi:SRPBCC family protein [uncultured Erythrobacter sp.]|uniref:SRPBCC family protein n=1 Tax=uncultured Erythrobacter sp. TaxID=263913 RepID=UPI00261E9E25|nr:SRPBCC family protein [uncultured Erythrobacter sp.]
MHRINRFVMATAGAAMAASASPALAEVAEANEDHFITRSEAVVEANAKETWLALISPAGWWSSEHTWSADSANLKLTPQAGGCFCETIPEVDEPGRITLEGSVEHMRVIQAYPEVALRMSGALGPLQSEPVSGVLTIALSDAEEGEDGSARTRIVWEYNVGGKMRYPIPDISRAVDGVMTLQLTRLAELLGIVEPIAAGDESSDESAEGTEDEALSAEAEGGTDQPAEVIENEARQSIDEVFEDLNGS